MCVAVCNVHDRAPCAAVRQQHRLTHVQHVVRKSTKVLRGCHLFLRCEHYTLQRHKNPKPKPKARGCNSAPAWFQGRTTRWAAWSTARERPDSCGRSPESAGKCRLHPPRSGKFRCLWETATPGGKSASVGTRRACNGTLVMQQFFFSGAGTCIETASTSFCRRLKPCSGVLASISSSRSSTDRSVSAIGCRGSSAAIEREGARSGITPAWR